MRVAILGCTGSVGSQALDVCRKHSDRLQVVALSAHSRIESLARAAGEFGVHHVCVTDEAAAAHAASLLPDGCTLHTGTAGLCELSTLDEVDCVLVSVVGAAGLLPSLAALRSGKRLALANKEALVIGGDLLMPLVAPGQLLPVDSEHSALFQCMQAGTRSEVYAIWLTCSGGPFFGMTRDELSQVTVEQTLNHPTWSMGPKITVDSATLMNKGLECIEAMHLFSCGIDDIRVLIHRQSKIHSMVEFADGSVIAHLGASDMRIPIQYALSYPERWDTPAERLDFRTLASLEFAAPDTDAFPCLRLAQDAGRTGGTAPCVLNAANEVSVQAFLSGECGFMDIPTVVEECLDAHDTQPVESVEQLLDIDAWARDTAKHLLRSRRL
ncbi:1-deoxy-D-xylulose-5-phosphate reductoisomerase [Collinsella sp. An2]|nr:1-deoxy-D-xylulose-5-phosphate reductoisomerase [Collinsella sp. An2]